MTKKDYIIIADALIRGYSRTEQTEDKERLFANIMSTLSYRLRLDNPKFNNVKFYAYVEKGLQDVEDKNTQ